MKVLVFGNPLLEEDNLPLRLLPALKKEFPGIDFEEADPADMDMEKGQVVVIDTAKGIGKDVMLLEDTEKLQDYKLLSAHGLGLAEMLSIFKVVGKKIDVRIICIPQDMPEKKALTAVTKMLRAIVP
ncbi:MAG: hypothetical protein V1887_04070 [Candidatus Aenigmatarchaeota archaeon]